MEDSLMAFAGSAWSAGSLIPKRVEMAVLHIRNDSSYRSCSSDPAHTADPANCVSGTEVPMTQITLNPTTLDQEHPARVQAWAPWNLEVSDNA